MAEQFYTTNEVCEMLKITRRTLYRWIVDKKIDAVKIGETWRISESALQKIINPGATSTSDNNQ